MSKTLSTNSLELAKSNLIAGSLVAIPTETVYGLAANAFNEVAISKIYGAKSRPLSNPLIVHVPDIEQAEVLLMPPPSIFYDLAIAFWPGPLTIILPKRPIISDLVTAGSPMVALRAPRHQITLELLRSIEFPLAAPSANPSGYVSPTTAAHVHATMGDRVSYILDGGPCEVGIESTIVTVVSDGHIVINRLGTISAEDLEKKAGARIRTLAPKNTLHTPGSGHSHYAPNKKLIVGDVDKLIENFKGENFAVLAFDRKYDDPSIEHQYVLSPKGCLRETAQNLFAGLRYLDALDVDYILTSYVPPLGIGLAINDKLRRASYEE